MKLTEVIYLEVQNKCEEIKGKTYEYLDNGYSITDAAIKAVFNLTVLHILIMQIRQCLG